jgi:predicted NUDIX family phosphoesterase
MGEKIIAVKQEIVNRISIPLGLIQLSSDVVCRYLTEMETEVCIEDRDFLEGNPDYRQLIPYPVICRKITGYPDVIFAAERTTEGGEHRLHNLMSVGFGGHARPINIGYNKLNLVEQIKLNALRELNEELVINVPVIIQFNGFINDLSNNVGRDHLGILIIVNLELVGVNSVKIREHGSFSRGKFYTKDELLYNDIQLENWSYLVVTNL